MIISKHKDGYNLKNANFFIKFLDSALGEEFTILEKEANLL